MTYKYIITQYIGFISLILFVTFQTSCKKYLAEKADKTKVVPSALSDLQALLDRIDIINQKSPELPEIVADNYYLTTTDYQSLYLPDAQTNYIWDKDATFITSWRAPYQLPIYYANIVLDQLPNINFKQKDTTQYNSIKGSALFIRAFIFQRLSDLYCRPYSSTASSDPGLVLRLTSNINEASVRSTVQITYDRIISDLKIAADLLPETSIYPTRPTKAAAYGALARTYLSMRDYVNAGYYADLSLQQNGNLMDYNTLIPAGYPSFASFNKETIYYSICDVSNIPYPPQSKIDSSLYSSYQADDLRKSLFFIDNGDGTFGFQGSYAGTDYNADLFDGIATDEIFLIRAESKARAGNKDAALSDLNMLLINRWRSGSFIPFTAVDANDALNKILIERRKELCFRSLRWSDLRRFNLEGANITLTRIINGITYMLPPNDPRWVMLIPKEIMSATNLSQNPR